MIKLTLLKQENKIIFVKKEALNNILIILEKETKQNLDAIELIKSCLIDAKNYEKKLTYDYDYVPMLATNANRIFKQKAVDYINDMEEEIYIDIKPLNQNKKYVNHK